MTLARSSIHFWAASRNGCKYGTVLLRNVIEKRVLGMSKTREEALAPFHATGTSRCVYQGSGPLDRSACSDTYGSSS